MAPPLASLTAWATFGVTVPTLGLGIRPRGPRTLPRRPTRAIMSGEAMTRSKSMKPPWTFSTRSSAPTTSAPAAVAASAWAPRAMTATRTWRPVPDGRATTPRTCWSAWRGSTPRLTAISMDSSNLALALAFTSFTASFTSWVAVRSPVQACIRLGCLAMVSGLHDLKAHRAGGALDDAGGGLDVVGVEVLHLLLGDVAQLGAGDLAGGVAARLLRARLDVQRLLDEEGGG